MRRRFIIYIKRLAGRSELLCPRNWHVIRGRSIRGSREKSGPPTRVHGTTKRDTGRVNRVICRVRARSVSVCIGYRNVQNAHVHAYEKQIDFLPYFELCVIKIVHYITSLILSG